MIRYVARSMSRRQMLSEVRRVVTSPLSAVDQVERIASLIRETFVAETVEIYSLSASGYPELIVLTGIPNRSPGHVFASDVVRSQGGVPISRAEHIDGGSFRVTGVPILRSGNVLGCISIISAHPLKDDDIEAVQTVAMVLAEITASKNYNKKRRERSAPKKKYSAVPASKISELAASRSALVNLREFLDGCVGADADPKSIGNKIQLPMSSDVIETIRVTADAAARMHDSPLITRNHVTILERVRTTLVEYNKTIDVFNGTIAKTTKLVWGITKLGAIPLSAAVMTQLSSVVSVTIGNLAAAVGACLHALGI